MWYYSAKKISIRRKFVMRFKKLIALAAAVFLCTFSAVALSDEEYWKFVDRATRLYSYTYQYSYNEGLYKSLMEFTEDFNALSIGERISLCNQWKLEYVLEFAESYKMIKAVEDKDYLRLQELLRNYKSTHWGPILDRIRNTAYESPMMHAIDRNDTEAINIMLEYDFPLSFVNPGTGVGGMGMTSLWTAYCIRQDNLEMLKFFYEKGIRPGSYEETPQTDEELLYAIKCGCSDELLLFLWENNADRDRNYVNCEEYSKEFFPLLYWLSSQENAEHVMKLLNMEYQAALLIKYHFYEYDEWRTVYYTVYEKMNPRLKEAIPAEYRKTFQEVFEEMSEEEQNAVLSWVDNGR